MAAILAFILGALLTVIFLAIIISKALLSFKKDNPVQYERLSKEYKNFSQYVNNMSK